MIPDPTLPLRLSHCDVHHKRASEGGHGLYRSAQSKVRSDFDVAFPGLGLRKEVWFAILLSIERCLKNPPPRNTSYRNHHPDLPMHDLSHKSGLACWRCKQNFMHFAESKQCDHWLKS